jgi:Na+/melibiose symporter-like transporter
MTSAATLPVGPLLAYGGLRLPLALLELPLFVLLPNFYSETLGLPLGLVGAVLFATRLIDAGLDPAIGSAIDRHANANYRYWIWLSMPLVALGFIALLHPPANSNYLAAWLGVMSLITYVGYSVSSIAYQAWGSRIGSTDAQRAQVTGIREACGLVGVLIAAAWLTPDGIPTLTTLFIVLSICAALLLWFAPTEQLATTRARNGTASTARAGSVLSDLRTNLAAIADNSLFRWLLAALLINGIATAIPATLLLFFVADILNAADAAPSFLLVYFLAGALGMTGWVRLSQRIGLRYTWIAGIGLSVVAFVWTLTLGRGDTASFYVICLLTGLALGADLAMPPALLASVITWRGDAGRLDGAYFGVWNFATKLNLAAAAGLALPLLSVSGYEPGMQGSTTLILVYAALPCAMKLLCGAVLWFAPIPDNPLSRTIPT